MVVCVGKKKSLKRAVIVDALNIILFFTIFLIESAKYRIDVWAVVYFLWLPLLLAILYGDLQHYREQRGEPEDGNDC